MRSESRCSPKKNATCGSELSWAPAALVLGGLQLRPMMTKSQGAKGCNCARFDSLGAAIETMNLAKEVTSIAPAEVVFGFAGLRKIASSHDVN